MAEFQIALTSNSLWRGGLYAMGRHVREWLPWAVLFFIAFIPFGFYQLRYASNVLSPHGRIDLNFVMAEMTKDKYGSIFLFLCLSIFCVQAFYFLIFFSTRELPIGQPGLSIDRFFYVMGIMFFYYGMWEILLVPQKFGDAGTMASSFVVRRMVDVVWYYFLIRLLLVVPLLINKIKIWPAIKTAWNLSKDNWWRLFGNYLLVVILEVFLYAVCCSFLVFLKIPTAFMRIHWDPANSMFQFFFGMALSSTIVLSTIFFTSFLCVATRILIEEKRQYDPSFVLESRA